MPLNGGMCVHVKHGGRMFPMKSKRNQSALNFSQPTDAWRESSGCSGKEGTATISLGKVGETKVAKKR